MIWSDNGKNFVGAPAELMHIFQEMDHKEISDFLVIGWCGKGNHH